VFGVNLLPAFGPPTWAVLVFFRLQSHLAAIPLVLVGAAAAAGGRLALAYRSRRFRNRLSPKRIANLEGAHDAIAGGPKRAAAGLALYALSPLARARPKRLLSGRGPSRQLDDLTESGAAAVHARRRPPRAGSRPPTLCCTPVARSPTHSRPILKRRRFRVVPRLTG
jgi:hypothetical protein